MGIVLRTFLQMEPWESRVGGHIEILTVYRRWGFAVKASISSLKQVVGHCCYCLFDEQERRQQELVVRRLPFDLRLVVLTCFNIKGLSLEVSVCFGKINVVGIPYTYRDVICLF